MGFTRQPFMTIGNLSSFAAEPRVLFISRAHVLSFTRLHYE